MREKILLIGVGELGGIVLEYLCRVPVLRYCHGRCECGLGFQEDKQRDRRCLVYGVVSKYQILPH